ncbi:MAG: hypothetical protein J6W09_04745, partial [Bacteroidales bacterium]|nr:hypothetical protein [Bacteroidales bacterium]
HFNMHFFFGAMYLFVINSVFIALATFLMVKYLRFRTVSGISPEVSVKRNRIKSIVLAIVIIPSLWTAFRLVGQNNFERNVHDFVEDNRRVGRSYLYDSEIEGRSVDFAFTGEALTDSLKADFYSRAAEYDIKPKNITLTEYHLGMSQSEMDAILTDVYSKAQEEREKNQATLDMLQARLDSLTRRLEAMEALQMQADTLLARNPEEYNPSGAI